jgi:translation initiation factor IF-2
MSQVTVSQLAEVLGISVEKLIDQMQKADIDLSSAEATVSNDDKKRLLAHLRSAHGKAESDATAPRKVTLKRKSVSELRIQGSGPRASTKTVNVEFRKRRTYVKREALADAEKNDPEREKIQQALKEVQERREAEERARKEAEEKARFEA